LNWEHLAQVGVGLALVCYGAWEVVRAAWKRLPTVKLPAISRGTAEPSPEEDRHTVLAIQGRLKANGNTTAAATAYKLLGEMLTEAK
jgi:hypothetical protein